MSCQWLRQAWADEQALTSVEYALLLAWVGAIAAVALLALSGAVSSQIDQTTAALDRP